MFLGGRGTSERCVFRVRQINSRRSSQLDSTLVCSYIDCDRSISYIAKEDNFQAFMAIVTLPVNMKTWQVWCGL